jgi:hypothetical protein
MFVRMAIFRIVAAPDMRASPTPAQMHPGIAHGDAFRATLIGRGYGLDRIQMSALLLIFSHFTPVDAQFAAIPPVIANFAPATQSKTNLIRVQRTLVYTCICEAA